MRPIAPVLLVCLLACAGPSPDQGPGVASPLCRELIDEVGEAYRQLELDEYLWLQVKHGVETTRLPDVSLAHAERRSREAAALLARLADIDGDDVERYLDLARQYAAFVDGLRGKLEGQERRGVVLPRDEIDLVLTSWRSLLGAPETVFPALADAPAVAPESFREELSRIVDTEVQPAWKQLIDFLGGPYRAGQPLDPGGSRRPSAVLASSSGHGLAVRFRHHPPDSPSAIWQSRNLSEKRRTPSSV